MRARGPRTVAWSSPRDEPVRGASRIGVGRAGDAGRVRSRHDRLLHAADDAAQATAELLPKIGRARPHAEKSLGHQDPGAKSLAIIINVVGEFLGEYEYE